MGLKDDIAMIREFPRRSPGDCGALERILAVAEAVAWCEENLAEVWFRATNAAVFVASRRDGDVCWTMAEGASLVEAVAEAKRRLGEGV